MRWPADATETKRYAVIFGPSASHPTEFCVRNLIFLFTNTIKLFNKIQNCTHGTD